jgi:hypothetical protein
MPKRPTNRRLTFADKTSGSNEILITALENLGGIYGLRGNFTDGDAALHRALTVIEASYGAGSPFRSPAGTPRGQFSGSR